MTPGGGLPTGGAGRGSSRFGTLWKVVRWGLAVSAAFLLAVAAFNFAVMPALVRQGKGLPVPDVTGMSLKQAAETLAAVQLAVQDTLERRGAGVPAGVVIDQVPSGGRTVKSGRRVRLVVSAGGHERSVPDMNGQTLRFARLSLGQEGYVLGDVVRIPAQNVGTDFVLASDPPPGTALTPGRSVSLLVSAPGSGVAWVLPDLRGRRLTRVEDELKLAGFSVQVTLRNNNRFGWSLEVVQTDPPPGSVVHRGDAIRLIGG